MQTKLRSDAFLQQAMVTCGDAVYRLALCRLNSRADAEDVYQEVFLRLLRDDTDFRDTEHLKAWLLRVTLSRAPIFAARRGLSAPHRWKPPRMLPLQNRKAAVSCGRRYTHCRTISESRCGCTMWRATAQRKSRKWSDAVRQRYARGCIAQESN